MDFTISIVFFAFVHKIYFFSLLIVFTEATALGVEDQPSSLLCVSWCLRLPHWDPSNVVVAALKHHASQGDIQTSASVLLALGEKRRSLINNAELDESTQEQWLLAYIDMLTRFKLWDVATQVQTSFIKFDGSETRSISRITL